MIFEMHIEIEEVLDELVDEKMLGFDALVEGLSNVATKDRKAAMREL